MCPINAETDDASGTDLLTRTTDLMQTFASMQLSTFSCVTDKLLHNEFSHTLAVMNVDNYVRGSVTIM